MVSFLDTSALLKRYHVEAFTTELRLHLKHSLAFVVSAMTKSELISAGWKKLRSTQPSDVGFDEEALWLLLSSFEKDGATFVTMPVEPTDWPACEELLHRCNSAGRKLHTPDALQLISALKLGDDVDEFITFDKGLREAAKFVGFHVPDF